MSVVRKASSAGPFWLVIRRGEPTNMHAFPTKRLAEHFIDHRTEGWDGWRLLSVEALAEYGAER